jgi:eukaryotic-like serine/threonine-protein kinase
VASDCPSAHELDAFHVGTLAEDRIDAVAEHLEHCPRCEAAIRRLDSSVDKALAAVRLAGPVAPSGPENAIVAALVRGADIDPTSPDNWPQLPGYEIVAAIGQGGMGAVYRARHVRLGRDVALKRIRTGRDRDLARSRAEAETLARLRHPNIVQIYEVVEHEDQVYLALELIEGGSLAAYLQGKPLRQTDTAALLETVARAVEHAHRHGVIHRDLKPANILLHQQDGPAVRLSGARRLVATSLLSPASLVPKVADFGIAKRLALDSGQTLEGDIIGTPSYMAPEQAAGKLDAIGPATDVYSLGVILYEMLTGRVPIQGPTTLDTLALVRSEEPVSPRRLQPRLARDLEVICLKCLEKQASRRYPSAEEFADDLRRFRYDQPIRARPRSALDRFAKFARRNKSLLAAGIGVVTALVIGMAFALFFAVGEARQRRVADESARSAALEGQVALRESYRGRIAAASAALLTHDVTEAALHLAAAPEAFRDWEWRYLHSSLDESSAVFPSRDGESVHLFTRAGDITLTFTSPRQLRRLDAGGRVTGVVPFRVDDTLYFGRTPRDSRFVTFDADRTSVLDGNGRILLRLPPSDAAVASLDGTRVAIRGTDFPEHDRFIVFDVSSGRELCSLSGHGQQLYTLTFSPDGKHIATACEDGTARIWDADTGRESAVLRGHALKVIRVAFRSDGKQVATCSADGTVRQWDPETGKELAAPYERHRGEVWVVAYSPDGRLISSAGRDRTIRLWDATTHRDVIVRHGHTDAIEGLAFSSDGRRLASWSLDESVRIWDVDESCTPPVLRGHSSYIYPIAFSPDGRWVASGSWDSTVRLWDARTGQIRRIWLHPSRVMDITFAPDSSRLLSICGEDAVVRVWDPASDRVVNELKVGDGPGWALACTADGTQVVAADSAGRCTVADIRSGARVASFHINSRCRLACSPNGHLLAVAGAGGLVSLWNTPEFHHEADLAGHTAAVNCLAFSHDGRSLVSASNDHTVRLWDVDSRQCRQVFRGQSDEIFAVAIHPDGRRIASAGREGVIWLWDVDTGSEVARLRGHSNYIWSLAFSPDGKTLASGSGDGTVRLWDTEPVADRYRALHELPTQAPARERSAGPGN